MHRNAELTIRIGHCLPAVNLCFGQMFGFLRAETQKSAVGGPDIVLGGEGVHIQPPNAIVHQHPAVGNRPRLPSVDLYTIDLQLFQKRL